ncbi:MAG: Na(+)/H(+) antiporter [Clostridia bacterium]|jgi:NhaP-type Na+/H+ or K+/H+ antiporter|nr:Na(+)/H(+) antiporter [Clostridia bacterium]
MAASLGIIILLGMFANWIFTKLKLPGLLGMLIVGVIIGPYGLRIIGSDTMSISKDLRQIALIIILLRAGIGIRTDDLKKVGSTALKMSCIPGIIEGAAIAFAATELLGFSFVQGGILGFIIAAVSPAVIVPQMLNFIEIKLGTNKSIPTLILAGASIDDVVAITLFSAFVGLYSGSSINIGLQLLGIPVSILFGIALGGVIGFILVRLFSRHHMRDSKKVLVILGIAILLSTLETLLKNKVQIASLLGVMTIGFILFEKMPLVGERLAHKFNKIWVFAEILLFVLVGAEVNITVALKSGGVGLVIILIGLVGRSIGVGLSVLGTNLNLKEKMFCVIAYVPKATVQAAMGAVPLALGIADGNLILAIAVLSIVITAPLGAIAIKTAAPRLLVQE